MNPLTLPHSYTINSNGKMTEETRFPLMITFHKGAFFWHQQMLLAEIWCDVTPIDVDKYGTVISSATCRVREPSTSKVFNTNFPSNTTSAHKRWRLCLDKRICICLICKWTACCLPPRETTLHL